MAHRKSAGGILIAGLLVMCLLVAGCLSQPAEEGTPTATPTPEATATTAPEETTTPTPEVTATTPPATEEFAFNETANGTTAAVPVGSRITITLDENPSTGYEWNVTSSEGLQYVNDTHDAPQTELVGAPGVHIWEYIAAETGSAEFSAIYKRPWEETIGNESIFSMAFTIE